MFELWFLGNMIIGGTSPTTDKIWVLINRSITNDQEDAWFGFDRIKEDTK